MELIDKALSSGMKPEELGKLMDLQERWEKNEATKAYGLAMTKFQSICHTVLKRRRASIRKDGVEQYSYAFSSYDDVMAEVGPALAQCGLAVTFSTSSIPDKPNLLRVMCTVRHGIHEAVTEMLLPIPQMTVNDTQKFGAAVSYGKRYAVCAALNIVTTDRDDDAQALVDTIGEAQIVEIRQLLYAKAVGEVPFLKWLKIEQIEDMNSRDYTYAVDYLRRKPTINAAPKAEEGGRDI
jgi:hypothetical protein